MKDQDGSCSACDNGLRPCMCNEFTCICCGESYSMEHTTRVNDGWCHSCSFWIGRYQGHLAHKDAKYPEKISFIVDGAAYYAHYTREGERGMGFGGSKFIFERLDTGEQFMSRDVWHQGTVPDNLKDLLPDNAKIVPEQPPEPIIYVDGEGLEIPF